MGEISFQMGKKAKLEPLAGLGRAVWIHQDYNPHNVSLTTMWQSRNSLAHDVRLFIVPISQLCPKYAGEQRHLYISSSPSSLSLSYLVLRQTPPLWHGLDAQPPMSRPLLLEIVWRWCTLASRECCSSSRRRSSSLANMFWRRDTRNSVSSGIDTSPWRRARWAPTVWREDHIVLRASTKTELALATRRTSENGIVSELVSSIVVERHKGAMVYSTICGFYLRTCGELVLVLIYICIATEPINDMFMTYVHAKTRPKMQWRHDFFRITSLWTDAGRRLLETYSLYADVR